MASSLGLLLTDPAGYKSKKRQQEAAAQEEDSQAGVTPVKMQKPSKVENEERPMTQKEQDVLELAQLICAAQDSVNNVVESLGHIQHLKEQNKEKRKSSIMVSRLSTLNRIQDQIDEDTSADNQIINNLDMMIQNLEKQQAENEKVQSKYSNNYEFATNQSAGTSNVNIANSTSNLEESLPEEIEIAEPEEVSTRDVGRIGQKPRTAIQPEKPPISPAKKSTKLDDQQRTAIKMDDEPG